MNTLNKYIILFAIGIQSSSFCNGQALTKTVVKNEDNKPIEYKYLDSELNTRMIENLNDEGGVVCTVWYNEKAKLIKLKTAGFTRDYVNNSYFDKATNTELEYADDRLTGSQLSNGIIVNYLNGKRNGVLIQADSVITGTKLYAYQRADIVALQRNKIEWITEVGGEPTFTLFNGYYLKYKDGELDGKQRGYYYNGKIKFLANFSNGKPVDFISYEKDGSIISKIKFKDGITDGKYILNGSVYSDTCILYFKSLDNAGVVVKTYPKKNDNNDNDDAVETYATGNYKYKWENNYKVERFAINKFDSKSNDEDAVLKIPYPIDEAQVDFGFGSLISGDYKGNQVPDLKLRDFDLERISKIYNLGKIIRGGNMYKFRNRCNYPDDFDVKKTYYPKSIVISVSQGLTEYQTYFIYNPKEYIKINTENEILADKEIKITASVSNPLNMYEYPTLESKVISVIENPMTLELSEGIEGCGGFFLCIFGYENGKHFEHFIDYKQLKKHQLSR